MGYEDLTFAVNHRAHGKGSMKHIGGGRMRDELKGTKPFANAVVEAAKKQMVLHPLSESFPLPRPETSVAVRAEFVFPRPKTTPKGQGATTRSTGDVDKLCRNLLDALTTAGVFVDDSQVTTLLATKRYDEGPDAYAYVTVRWLA